MSPSAFNASARNATVAAIWEITSYLGTKGVKNVETVVVGRDMRPSSPDLAKAPFVNGGQIFWRVAATDEGNNLGGYASGTVHGVPTRRYHGLLVVAGDTPASRHLGLASLDPVVTLPSGAVVRLGVHEWADGAIAPAGHRLLAGFALARGETLPDV